MPAFIQRHCAEQVTCLEQRFDVVLASEDCDYEALCEAHQPDLALFESGVYSAPRTITRVSRCPEVPKLGFCNSDAYCVTRSVFLSDMEHWGVETFFTHSLAMAEYTPELADRLFVWPNFVDTRLYRDYGQEKNIPVLFTGSQAAHYPWRNRVHSALSPHYPCLTTPHTGWFDKAASARMVHGDTYAKLINASWVAPTCGTIAREVVRKHFEIPASRTCLVTERSASLEAAGFADMRNVVFAEPENVVDKLNFLFSHPDELHRIIDAGFELVHSRHTMEARDQVFQWLSLYKLAKPGETIVQGGPFEPLRLVSSRSGARNAHPRNDARDRALLQEGERLLMIGMYRRAESLFLRCLNYHFMPEPVVGLARASLYAGNAAGAIDWIAQPIELCLGRHGSRDPDPVEWAYLIRALTCEGNLSEAARRARQFPTLSHVELDRIRQVIAALAGGRADTGGRVTHPMDRKSVHQLPERDEAAWTADLCTMLRACDQDGLATVVSGTGSAARRAKVAPHDVRKIPSVEQSSEGILPLVVRAAHIRLAERVKDELRRVGRRTSAGSPLEILRNLSQKEDIEHALLLGASVAERSTRSVLAGLRKNANRPELLWLNDASPRFALGRGRGRGARAADAVANQHEGSGQPIELVVIGRHATLDGRRKAAMESARFVLLTGINYLPIQRLHARLIDNPEYALIAHHPQHDGGYAVFRRLSAKANPQPHAVSWGDARDVGR